MKRNLISLLSLLAVGVATRAENPAPVPPEFADLKHEIETVLKSTRTPGAAVAIVSRDRVEWASGLGVADVATGRPATAETLFRLGSVSKSFAALAALRLQEDGRLVLTDPVKRWAPELPLENPWEASDPVRLVHLMEHTAGFDDFSLVEQLHNEPAPIALKDALLYRPAARVVRWRPGSRMAYSNCGPAVLAYVIEKITGQRFEDYVAEHVFRPLRMSGAGYFLTPVAAPKLATGYRDGVTPVPYWHVIFRPAGAANVSAEDMANYVRLFLGRGRLDRTRLLAPESIARMEKTGTLPASRLGDFAGYGLFHETWFEKGIAFHGHNGALWGGLSVFGYAPELGAGYAIMINSDRWDALAAIQRRVTDHLTNAAKAPVLPPAHAVPAEIQQAYSGYYQGISPRVQWQAYADRLQSLRQVTVGADGLTMRHLGNGSVTTWVAVSERLFRRPEAPIATLALLPAADGEGQRRIQSADTTWKQVSAFRVWGQFIAAFAAYALMFSSIVFAGVWGVRKLFGKLRTPGPLAVRTLPLVASLLFFTWMVLLARATGGDVAAVLGRATPVSVALLVIGVAFAAVAAAGFVVVVRARNAPMNRIAYWHSALVALSTVLLAGYLLFWGMIGVRTWV